MNNQDTRLRINIKNPNTFINDNVLTDKDTFLYKDISAGWISDELTNNVSFTVNESNTGDFINMIDFDIDYYMDDGSILGDLIRPIPVEKTISPEKKEIIPNFAMTYRRKTGPRCGPVKRCGIRLPG